MKHYKFQVAGNNIFLYLILTKTRKIFSFICFIFAMILFFSEIKYKFGFMIALFLFAIINYKKSFFTKKENLWRYTYGLFMFMFILVFPYLFFGKWDLAGTYFLSTIALLLISILLSVLFDK